MDHLEMYNAVVRALRGQIESLSEQNNSLQLKFQDTITIATSLAYCLNAVLEGHLSDDDLHEYAMLYDVWNNFSNDLNAFKDN